MTTSQLDNALAGGIIRLMCLAWGDGTDAPTLPADETELCRMAGFTSPEQWATFLEVVREQWRARDDGRHYFADQMAQYEQKAQLSGKRAKAGGRGGLTKAARHERARVLAVTNADEIDGTWLKIRAAYPKRDGDHKWRMAERHYRAAIARGTLPADMLAGVERYHAKMAAEAKIGTPYVKQAATFFGPEQCWEEAWAVAERPRPLSTIAERMRTTRVSG